MAEIRRRGRHRALSVWVAINAPLIIASLILVFALPQTNTLLALLLVPLGPRVRGVDAPRTPGHARDRPWQSTIVITAAGVLIAIADVEAWRITLAIVFGIPAAALVIANIRELARR